MRYFLFLLLTAILILSAASVFAQTTQKNSDTRPLDIIKETRKSLGGQKLESLQSLSAKGKLLENYIGDNSIEGEFEFTFLLPDKFLKSETKSLFGDDQVTELQAVDGKNEWFDAKMNGANGGGNTTFVRPNMKVGNDEKPVSIFRQMATRFYLGMFAAAPSSLPVEYSYVGTAQSKDGTADVIDVKGEEFNARLFIDQKTHLPLMITYKSSPPVMQMTMEMPDPKNKNMEGNSPIIKAPPLQDFQMTFEDFRETQGVRLPYRITEIMNGKPVKEWNVNTYKINPSVKPEIFVKKSK